MEGLIFKKLLDNMKLEEKETKSKLEKISF